MGLVIEATRTEGESQGQSIASEIMKPRDRDTHGRMREKICRAMGRLIEAWDKKPLR